MDENTLAELQSAVTATKLADYQLGSLLELLLIELAALEARVKALEPVV